jgi:hypothetical protein
MMDGTIIKPPAIPRTCAGLREVLFQEIEAVRAGLSTPAQAICVAALTRQVVALARFDLEVAASDVELVDNQVPTVRLA